MLFNPFIIYSIMWLGVLFLYSLKIGLIYPLLNNQLYIFLITTSLISLIIGFLLKKDFKLNKMENNVSKYQGKIVVFICIYFFIELIIEGKIPFLEIIKKTGYTRHDFLGIKSLHYLMIVFTVFYSQRLVSIYIATHKKINILYYIILNLFFMIFYLRGVIFISIFMSLVIFIINKKISLKKLIMCSLILIYLFGIIGNIREGDSWNGNKTFIKSGVIKENNLIDGPWIFSYVYFTNSLANLSLNVEETKVKISIKKFAINNIFPDFIIKRISNENPEDFYKLIMPTLTTITTYAAAYLYLGFLGMYVLFFIYIIIILFYLKIILKRTIYQSELMATLFTILFFTFFTNTLTFSLISLQLIFPLINYSINVFLKPFFRYLVLNKKYQ